MIDIYEWCKQQEEPIDVKDMSTGLIFKTSGYIRALLLKEEHLPTIHVYDNDGKRLGVANPASTARILHPEPILYVPQKTLED